MLHRLLRSLETADRTTQMVLNLRLRWLWTSTASIRCQEGAKQTRSRRWVREFSNWNMAGRSISVRAERSARHGMKQGGKSMAELPKFVDISLLPVDFCLLLVDHGCGRVRCDSTGTALRQRLQAGAGRLSATVSSSWSSRAGAGSSNDGQAASSRSRSRARAWAQARAHVRVGRCLRGSGIAAAAAGGRRATVSDSEQQLEQQGRHGKQRPPQQRSTQQHPFRHPHQRPHSRSDLGSNGYFARPHPTGVSVRGQHARHSTVAAARGAQARRTPQQRSTQQGPFRCPQPHAPIADNRATEPCRGRIYI